MNTYRTFSEEEQEDAIKLARGLIPDDAELVLLSFTGGRAFGWGHERHDIDVHGFFVKEDWFFKCHSMLDGFDMTLTNVKSVDNPDIRWKRWKQYYDKSNPIYVHDDFDFWEDFMSKCKPEYVKTIFPYDLELQMARMDLQFRARSALHTYKEMMIAHNYLENQEIETNIVDNINEKPSYQYEGLKQCATKYRDRENIDLDESLIRGELDEMYDRLEESLIEHTDYKNES